MISTENYLYLGWMIMGNSKMKYSWYSCEDRNRPWPDGNHKNIVSCKKAITDALAPLFRDKNKKDFVIVGTHPFGTNVPWDKLELTIEQIEKMVSAHGWCQFELREKGKLDTHVQGWSSV